MKKISPEKRKELEERRNKLNINLYYQSIPELKFLMDNNYPFEIEYSSFHSWIFDSFPMDCKLSSAWIDWSKVERCKRWFPHNNETDATLKIRDIINEFQLGNPEVYFDAVTTTVKTNLLYIAEYFDDFEQKLPGFDTYIWNPADKWVIEVPVSNYNYPYSVNFGYSDSDWKERNRERFAGVRGKR